MAWLDVMIAAAALGVALLLRPWRGLARQAPPWPWLAWMAVMPLGWVADRFAVMPVAQPLAGAGLLLLMLGWPLAMLALLPVALAAALLGGLDLAETLHRGVWLGVLPCSLVLLLGAGVRRWLPQHLFVYILGRGFFSVALAGTLVGIASALLQHAPGGLGSDDLMLARGLTAWGDAFICGMCTAIFVAFRPQWLATYSDRLYLPT